MTIKHYSPSNAQYIVKQGPRMGMKETNVVIKHHLTTLTLYIIK